MTDAHDPARLSVAEVAALSAQVRETLTPTFVADALRTGLPHYRARVLTIEVVVLCVLDVLIRGLPSVRALVRELRLVDGHPIPRKSGHDGRRSGVLAFECAVV